MQHKNFTAFNTPCTVSIMKSQLSPTEEAEALVLIENACLEYENIFSRFNPKSQLYQLNHAQGAWLPVDAELYNVLNEAFYFCEDTKGLFDITMGSVCKLWDFKQQRIPSQAALSEALKDVDWHAVQTRISPQGVPEASITNKHAWADLGGIVKGYVADILAKRMRNTSVESALINLGGNVKCVGAKPNGKPWNVGIRKPVQYANSSTAQALSEAPVLATIPVVDKSVVTSGTYERAFTKNSQLYHHILDPRTGMPAKTDIVSVSVISENSIDGDGYSTALLIMGSESALEFCAERPEIDIVLLLEDGRLLTSFD